MNRKIYSIVTVVAVSFVLILGFGAFNAAKAVPGTSGERVSVSTADVDLLGFDGANNVFGTSGRNFDAAIKGFAPDTYGVHGTLRP